MQGYIINLYKYASYPSSRIKDMSDLLQKRQAVNSDVKSKLGKDKCDTTMRSLLAYGDFDRINIQPITDFTRYRDVGDHTKNWLGPRQSILLYPIPPCSDASGSDLLDRIIYPDGPRPADDHRLLIITMAALFPEFRHSGSFGEKLKVCKECILKSVETFKNRDRFLRCPSKIDCEVYGTFSSSELVIVWHAAQYSDVLRIVNALRYMTFHSAADDKSIRPIASFYSIIAQSNFCRSNGDFIKDPTFVYGDAELFFQWSDLGPDLNKPDNTKHNEKGSYSERLLKHFNSTIDERRSALEAMGRSDIAGSIYSAVGSPSVGEYDYCVRLPADIICNPDSPFFHNSGELHWRHEDYSTHVQKTITRLLYSDGNLESVSPDTCTLTYDVDPAIGKADDILSFNCDEITGIHAKIYGADESLGSIGSALNRLNYGELSSKYGLRKILKKTFPESVGMCDTLDLLYLDYVNNCSNMFNDSWASDLTVQFRGVLDYISHLVYCYYEPYGEGDPDKQIGIEKVYSSISDIIEVFNQIIYHVAQSKRAVFVVPSCHLRYSGQYDMILQAYYGLQKYLLDLSYELDSTDLQPELIPLFSIDVVPDLRSELYKFKPMASHGAPGAGKTVNASGIISINLPSSSMGDFLRYSMVIVHETFHQITPHDRNMRNQVLGMLRFAEACASLTLTGLVEHLESLEKDPSAHNSEIQFIRDWYDCAIIRLIPLFCENAANFYMQNVHERIMREHKSMSEYFPIWEEYALKVSEIIAEGIEDTDSCLLEKIAEIIKDKNESISETIRDFFMQVRRDYETENGYDPLSDGEFEQIMDAATGYAKAGEAARSLPDRVTGLHTKLKVSDLTSNMIALDEGFREACQDLPMIRLFGLSFVDYLVFRDRHKRDFLDLGKKNGRSDRWRIAMLCDYLISAELEDEKISPDTQVIMKRLDDKFDEYVDIFKRVPGMEAGPAKAQAERMEMYKRSFYVIRHSVSRYFERFSPVSTHIKSLLKQADIALNSKMHGKLQNGFLSNSYQRWKDALFSYDNTAEGLREKNEAIFANNIQMIHYFQEQRAISSSDALARRNRAKSDPEAGDSP